MTRNEETTASTQPEIPGANRCRYSSRRKGRCSRPLVDDSTGLCILHHRLHTQRIQSQTRAVSEELLADSPNLENREDVRAALSNLFRLFAQKRIDRTDASLLAYIASLVFQGLLPLTPPHPAAPASFSTTTDFQSAGTRSLNHSHNLDEYHSPFSNLLRRRCTSGTSTVLGLNCALSGPTLFLATYVSQPQSCTRLARS